MMKHLHVVSTEMVVDCDFLTLSQTLCFKLEYFSLILHLLHLFQQPGKLCKNLLSERPAMYGKKETTYF
jgi:hypothetical protein